MNPPMDYTKIVTLLPPQLIDNDDFAGNVYVDTAGWNHLRVCFIVGTVDAAIGSTAEGTAPLVEECDTTDGTYTDVTDAALADAIGATEDDNIFGIDVDLAKTHKRYMQVQVPHAGDGTTGCNLAIVGILSKPQGEAALTATAQGLLELIKA